MGMKKENSSFSYFFFVKFLLKIFNEKWEEWKYLTISL